MTEVSLKIYNTDFLSELVDLLFEVCDATTFFLAAVLYLLYISFVWKKKECIGLFMIYINIRIYVLENSVNFALKGKNVEGG